MTDKRFVQGSGTNVFNGNELIVKGALESKVGLIAGYPGSPVAEVYTILEENADILREHGLWGELTNDETLEEASDGDQHSARVEGLDWGSTQIIHLFESRCRISDYNLSRGGRWQCDSLREPAA